GTLPTGYPQAAKIERINSAGERTLIDIDLTTANGRNTAIQPGDVLKLPSVLEGMENIVFLAGHVHRPGIYQWRSEMKLVDLIPRILDLQPKADLEYILIRREEQPERTVRILSANLAKALGDPESDHNIGIYPRDQVFVFDLDGNKRQLIIEPLLEELSAQAEIDQPLMRISVTGHVRAPGSYPLEAGMRILDLIRAAGNLRESAYTLQAELTRFAVIGGEAREVEHLDINLPAVLNDDVAANMLLSPYDVLHIKSIPNWGESETIEVRGEVRFPGVYQIRKGETIRAVLERAGGLTEYAFIEGAVFTREQLKEKEAQQIDALASQLETDLASMSLQDLQSNQDAQEAFQIGQSLAQQLREVQPIGRLVVDLDEILAGKRRVVVKDGDRLFIPTEMQEVTVIGEVQYATSHVHKPQLDRDDYIELSGSTTRRADKRRIYIVRANGSVEVGKGSIDSIRPGDTIVVPLNVDRVRPLTLLTNISQVLFQLGIFLASGNAVGVF
ncbi:MAG: SLBB domain-containing protein, partial [Gammaproteobacteria bacterium]|nr:SLBB domain-containing protein [Gammaproteobacteria bacterium]